MPYVSDRKRLPIEHMNRTRKLVGTTSSDTRFRTANAGHRQVACPIPSVSAGTRRVYSGHMGDSSFRPRNTLLPMSQEGQRPMIRNRVGGAWMRGNELCHEFHDFLCRRFLSHDSIQQSEQA